MHPPVGGGAYPPTGEDKMQQVMDDSTEVNMVSLRAEISREQGSQKGKKGIQTL
jgi:hypothetical protein